MHLKNLSNLGLHEKLVSLAAEERKLTLEVLEHLREVDRRRLYAERGRSSLFEYAVQELKYSESAAQRRIFAMRALRDLPELKDQIWSGALKVTQLAQVQSFFRAESNAGNAYSLSQKRDMIQATVGKSTRETEKILAEKNPVYGTREKVRVLTATQTQITFTADDSLMGGLQAVRDRFADVLPIGASVADLVRFMATNTLKSVPEKKEVRRKNPLSTSELSTSGELGLEVPSLAIPASAIPASLVPTSALPAPVLSTRYIPVAVKRVVWKRDEGQCTYISPTPEKRCASRHRIQIDHIEPFSRGGKSTTPDNLRLLCFSHNQYEASRILGGKG